MTELLGILGSAAGGGLLGLIGTIWKGNQENKDRQAQRAHDLDMRKADKEEMQLEAELALKQTELETAGKLKSIDLEGDIERDIQAAKLQQESYGNDKAAYGNQAIQAIKGRPGTIARFMLVCVDVCRGFMRPGITTYLLIIESAIAYNLFGLLKQLDIVTGPQALTLLTDIVHSLVFLTATAVTWWFGSRPNQSRK